MTGVRLIAEIGVNHDGDLARAIAMTRSAAAAGFDAVKLQYWNVDELLAPDSPNAPYQGPGDQHDLLARLRLDVEQMAEVARAAGEEGIALIVTPDGERACRELAGLPLGALKIGSGDADNPWLLEAVVTAGRPVIASIGMMSDEEVTELVDRLGSVPDLTLLHCVSAYPTPLSDIGLDRMQWLREVSGRPVGLSDHTLGVAAAVAAVALGAVAIEKHVTWSTTAPGPDHAMSLRLDEAGAWITTIRDLSAGLTHRGLQGAETSNRPLVRKGLYLRRDLALGEEIGHDDVLPLRPLGDGIPAGSRDVVAGRRVCMPLRAGHLLRWHDLDR